MVQHQDAGFAIVCRDAAEIYLTQLNDKGWRERSDLRERPVISGAESFLSGTGTCRVQVQGLDELFLEYRNKGVLGPNAHIRNQWWGDSDFVVLDADRNAITFFEPPASN